MQRKTTTNKINNAFCKIYKQKKKRKKKKE